MTVESEIMEQWSPMIAPDSMAATRMFRGMTLAEAMGTTMGIMMAKVPQELPVEKAIRQAVMNTSTGTTRLGRCAAVMAEM